MLLPDLRWISPGEEKGWRAPPRWKPARKFGEKKIPEKKIV
jgi:hypothetical protein